MEKFEETKKEIVRKIIFDAMNTALVPDEILSNEDDFVSGKYDNKLLDNDMGFDSVDVFYLSSTLEDIFEIKKIFEIKEDIITYKKLEKVTDRQPNNIANITIGEVTELLLSYPEVQNYTKGYIAAKKEPKPK